MVMSVSVVKNSSQARSYFSEDNYYREGDSEQTRWGGALAEEFGIDGHAVDADLFFQMLNGQMPSGEKVQRGPGEGVHKPATDLTFNAPKDVSIAAYHCGDARVIEAHRRAIESTMRYAERELAMCRKKEKTGNLLWAVFNHDTNRLEEAHLHDHVLVLNATRRPDGKIRAIENRPLFQHQLLLGAIYHAEMRHEIELLGYTTRDLPGSKNGEFSLAEIDQQFARENSTRRQDLENYLRKRGIDPASASQKQLDNATKATRKVKREIDHDALHERQRAEFRARFPDWKMPGLNAESRTAIDGGQRDRAAGALDFALEHYMEKTNGVRPNDLLRTALAESGGVKLATMEAEIQTRIADGRLIAGDRLITTQSAQEREREMLAVMERGRGAMAPVVSATRADELLGPSTQTETAPVSSSFGMNLRPSFDVPRGPDGRPLYGSADTPPPPAKRQPVTEKSMFTNHAGRTNRDTEAAMWTGKLNAGQMRAADLMLTSTDRINVIQGVAGAGKTHLLSTVRDELEASGYNIFGLAPTDKATEEMRDKLGKGITLQSFLVNPKAREGLNSKSIIICDEAGMASSQQMRDLLQHVERAGARVYLIGDDRQFKAVEAGNPFRQLQQNGVAMAEMNESVRQKDPNLINAVALMNEGHIKEGLALLPIREIADKGQRHQAIADEYLALGVDERKEAIVLTGTNDDRRSLNDKIREGLGLKGKGEEIDVIDKANLSGAEQRKAKNYQPGQMIQFQKDMKRLGVHSKDLMGIESVDTERGTLKLRAQDGRQVDFQPHMYENTKAWSVHDREKMEFAPGDEIRFRSSQKTTDGKGFEWHNNDRGRVIDIDRDTGFMRVANDSKGGKEVSIDLSRPAAVTHGYGATGHSAQGVSRDTKISDYRANSPTTTKESLYTNETRARYNSIIYTDDRAALMQKAERGIDKSNALDVKERDQKALQAPEQAKTAEKQPPALEATQHDKAKALASPEKAPEAAKTTEQKAAPEKAQSEQASELPSQEGKSGPQKPAPEVSQELASARQSGEKDLGKSGFYAERENPTPAVEMEFER